MPEPIADRPLPDEKIGADDADLLQTARARYEKAIEADRENREQAVDDLRFLAGEQWEAEVVQERKDDQRPVITNDRLSQVVKQIVGDFRQNRPSIHVRPVDDKADKQTADVHTGLIRHIQAASDAMVSYQHGVECAAGCGIGHFRVVTAYSSNDTFDQDIRIRRIADPLSVVWDPGAVDPVRADARYCFVEQSLDRESYKARYPDSTVAEWPSEAQAFAWTGDWVSRDTVRVAEYWTVTPQKRTIARLLDDTVLDITELKPTDEGFYADTNGQALEIRQTRQVWRNKVEMRIINGAEVLEGPFEWAGTMIPIIPVTGEEIFIGPRRVRMSAIRRGKDPQKMHNYFVSAQTELMASQPISPWMVTAKNIEGYEAVWKDANRRRLAYLPHTPDPANNGIPPQRNTPPMASAGLFAEAERSAQAIEPATAMYKAAIGAPSNEKSGRAIRERREASDTANYLFADNAARAIRRCGEILIELVPQIYDTPRTVRILNEDESVEIVEINRPFVTKKGEKLLHDLSTGEYDVTVTIGPTYATKREEAADTLLEFMRILPPQQAVMVTDLVAKNMDWPEAREIARRFRRTLPPGLVEPEEGEEPPAPDPRARVESMEKMAEVNERMAKTEKLEAETEEKQLANLKSQIEIATQNGTLDRVIAQRVEEIMNRMFASDAAEMGAPAAGPGPNGGVP